MQKTHGLVRTGQSVSVLSRQSPVTVVVDTVTDAKPAASASPRTVLSTTASSGQTSEVMKYLVVDGMMSGTGLRDGVDGGYLELECCGLSDALVERMRHWLRDYEEAHFDQYGAEDVVARLDKEGLSIRDAVSNELPTAKVQYYSSAKTRMLVY